MNKIIIILLLISTPAFADNAIKVKAGDIVPMAYDQGTLLDKSQADKIKDQLIERDEFQKENNSFKKSIELYEANKTLYRDENSLLLGSNVKCTEALNDSRKTNTMVILGYIAATVGILYIGTRLSK